MKTRELWLADSLATGFVETKPKPEFTEQIGGPYFSQLALSENGHRNVGSKNNMRKLKLLLFLSVSVNVVFIVISQTFKLTCTHDLHLRAAATARAANDHVLQTVLNKLESDDTNRVDEAIKCLRYALPHNTGTKKNQKGTQQKSGTYFSQLAL
jgi:hypothetical protein